MPERTIRRAALTLSLMIGLLTIPMSPANAGPDWEVVGWRCKQAPWPDGTNENTVLALKSISGITYVTVKCETDYWLAANADGDEAEGPPVDFHDEYWKPKADDATLNGIPARVADTTPRQIRQIRTDGGERIPTLKQMIAASGRHDVVLMGEWKWDMSPWARRIMRWARRAGTRFETHGILGKDAQNCRWHNVDAFVARGARVGVKSNACLPTPQEARQHGVDYVTRGWRPEEGRWAIRRWTKRGIDVYSHGVPPNEAKKAHRWGVSGTVVPNPMGYVRKLKTYW